jgi:hypothetical protein
MFAGWFCQFPRNARAFNGVISKKIMVVDFCIFTYEKSNPTFIV